MSGCQDLQHSHFRDCTIAQRMTWTTSSVTMRCSDEQCEGNETQQRAIADTCQAIVGLRSKTPLLCNRTAKNLKGLDATQSIGSHFGCRRAMAKRTGAVPDRTR